MAEPGEPELTAAAFQELRSLRTQLLTQQREHEGQWRRVQKQLQLDAKYSEDQVRVLVHELAARAEQRNLAITKLQGLLDDKCVAVDEMTAMLHEKIDALAQVSGERDDMRGEIERLSARLEALESTYTVQYEADMERKRHEATLGDVRAASRTTLPRRRVGAAAAAPRGSSDAAYYTGYSYAPAAAPRPMPMPTPTPPARLFATRLFGSSASSSSASAVPSPPSTHGGSLPPGLRSNSSGGGGGNGGSSSAAVPGWNAKLGAALPSYKALGLPSDAERAQANRAAALLHDIRDGPSATSWSRTRTQLLAGLDLPASRR
jgi:hypothetical protein